jgi:hypothetical protein
LADDNKLDFILDLDSTEFARKIIEGVGHVEGLAASLESVVMAAGLVGTAFLAVKTSMDLTFEAETIKAINAQFEILAKQAGLAGEAIKEGMNRASGGLLSETEQLQLANKAIIDLGASASKIPQIMELARQVSMVTGQNLAETFTSIEQAVATGQTRMLKHYGIVVDSEKAYRDYAASLGIAANELNKTGQAHAILNQTLEQGHQKYGNVQVDVKQATNAWQAFKVALSDIGETATLVYDKLAGPSVRSAMNWLKDWAESTKLALKATFGEGAEAAGAHSDYLKERVRQLKTELDKLSDNQTRITDPFAAAANSKDIERVKKNLAEAEYAFHSYAKAQAEAEEKAKDSFVGPQEPPKAAEKTPGSEVDLEQRKRNQAAFQRDIAALQQEALDQRKQLMTTDAEAEAYMLDQKIQINEQAQAKIAEIQASHTLNPGQKEAEIAQIEANRTQLLVQAEQQRLAIHQQAAENMNKVDQQSVQGFANAWASGSRQAQLSLTDWNTRGKQTFQSFANNATSALQAFGAGQKSASEAAKAFIFGMLADRAEAEGKIMLLASVWPPNPAGLAAGAGLIALSGFLRSQGAGSGGGGGGAEAGASASAGYFGSSAAGANASLQAQQEKKSVTVQVMGDFLSTEQTQNRLVEIIRQATDANDFTITGGR